MAKKNKPKMSVSKIDLSEKAQLAKLLKRMDIDMDVYAIEKNNTKNLLDGLKQITDLWVIVAGQVGNQTHVEPMLSEIYNKHKLRYHEAREEYFSDKYTPNNYSILTEIRIQKVLGVLAYDRKINDFTNTEKLLKTAFKQQYNYCKNRNRISLGDYFQRDVLSKKISTQDKFLGLRNASVVALYFFLTEQSFIDTDESESVNADVNQFVNAIESLDLEPVTKEKARQADLPKFVEYMFTAFTQSVFRGRKELDLSEIWESTYEVANGGNALEYRDKGKIPPYVPTATFSTLLDLLEIQHKNLHLHEVVAHLGRFEALGLSKRYFLEQRISIEEFQAVLKHAINKYTHNDVKGIDFVLYFMDTLATSILTNDYLVLRHYRLRDSEIESLQQEKVHLENTTAQENLIAQLQQQLKRKSAENEQLLKQAKSNVEVMELRKRVRELEKQLEQKEDNSQELFALREFVFEADNKDTHVSENIDYAEALQNERIVCIGGHDNWIMYMKRVLPNALFLNADSNGRDYARIKQPNTYVFVHTAYNNHGTYYKAVAGLKHTDNKLYFINNNNVDLILRDMYNKIVQQSPAK